MILLLYDLIISPNEIKNNKTAESSSMNTPDGEEIMPNLSKSLLRKNVN